MADIKNSAESHRTIVPNLSIIPIFNGREHYRVWKVRFELIINTLLLDVPSEHHLRVFTTALLAAGKDDMEFCTIVERALTNKLIEGC